MMYGPGNVEEALYRGYGVPYPLNLSRSLIKI
jgi:hypothetical protein